MIAALLSRLVPRVVFALPLLFALAGCGKVNEIPQLDEATKAAWSQVQNQYQRSSDLVPNLVETVRGYAKQEQDTLKAVVEARAKTTQMQIPADLPSNPEAFKRFQDNQAALTSSLSRLLAVSENYPDLKSNQNFLALHGRARRAGRRVRRRDRRLRRSARGACSARGDGS